MYRVRLITPKSRLLKQYYQKSLAWQGWRPCVGDIDCFLELDPTGFYVGELNNKPISTYSIVKYANSHHHVGSFYVEKPYRKCGYGSSIHRYCIINSLPPRTATGYASPSKAIVLEKSLNMISRWTVGIYDINITKALNSLRGTSDCCEVERISKINIEDIYNYDTEVFGYNRSKFLQKWLNTPGTHARAAIDKGGSIVGYVAVRMAFLHEEGYKIGPLYCEDVEVGKALLKGVFEDIRERGLSTSNSVIVDSPTGRNPQAKELMKLVQGKYLGYNEFMTSNGLPKGHFDQWFAITSPTIG